MSKKKVNVGLDIGIASVGWSITDDETMEIIDAGSRLFEESGSSSSGGQTTTEDRRKARGLRRQLRRKKLRLKDLTQVFIKHDLIKDENELKKILIDESGLNQLDVREKSLDKEIDIKELIVILYTMMKNRGSFNLKEELLQDNDSVIDIDKIEKMNQNKLPYKIQKENLSINGKFKGEFNRISHENYIKEIDLILKKQSQYNKLISSEFSKDFFDIFNRKRGYNEGPGGNSPFGWKGDEEFMEKIMGKDNLSNGKIRAPKESLSAYIFNLLNDLNNLTIKLDTREETKLTKEEKINIINDILCSETTNNLTLKKLHKFLEIPYINEKETLISGFRIDAKEKPIFTKFDSINEIKKNFINNKMDISFLKLDNIKIIDDIIKILTIYQTIDNRIKKLKSDSEINNLLNNEQMTLLSNMHFNGTHAYSFETLELLINEMLETTENSMQVITRLGLKKEYHFNKVDSKYIPILKNDINELFISPVVKRSFIQTLKVFKEIEKNDYEINNVVIELAREKNSKEQKDFIKKMNKDNLERTKRIIKEYSLSKEPSIKVMKKIRLYDEQNQICLYCGKHMDIDEVLKEQGAYEIDHIIPRSISYVDSFKNLALVHKEENHKKGNRTPREFFNSVDSNFTYSEFYKLLMKMLEDNKNKNKYFRNKMDWIYNMDAEIMEINSNGNKSLSDFIDRNLNDTRSATRFIRTYLEEYKKAKNKTWKVKTINGSMTSFLRKNIFKLIAKDRDLNKHHAIDATLISLIPKIEIFNKYTKLSDYEFKRSIQKYVELGIKIDNYNNFKFTRMGQKNNNQGITNDTIYSIKFDEDEGKWVKKSKIDILSDDIDKIDKLFTKDSDKLYIKHSDKVTFDYLQKIYDEYKGIEFVDSNNRKQIVKNPFLYFVKNMGQEIRKQHPRDKNIVLPKIQYLRYKGDSITNYLDVTHKYPKMKNDHSKIVMGSLKPFWVELWYSKAKDKKIAMVVNVNVIKHIGQNEIIIDEKKYNDKKNKLRIDESYEKIINLYKGDNVYVLQKGSNKQEKLYFVGVTEGKSVLLEFKPLDKLPKERLRLSALKIDEIYHCKESILGI